MHQMDAYKEYLERRVAVGGGGIGGGFSIDSLLSSGTTSSTTPSSPPLSSAAAAAASLALRSSLLFPPCSTSSSLGIPGLSDNQPVSSLLDSAALLCRRLQGAVAINGGQGGENASGMLKILNTVKQIVFRYCIRKYCLST
jgi:hypothetical protein